MSQKSHPLKLSFEKDQEFLASVRLAVVASQFNESVVHGLQSGVRYGLEKLGIQIATQVQTFESPGAFELPILAKALAQSGKYDAIVTLGCVIKGETAHFEYICDAAAHGLMQAGLDSGVPIAFGVLTTYTVEQALARSRSSTEAELIENKGREALVAALSAAHTLSRLPKSLENKSGSF